MKVYDREMSLIYSPVFDDLTDRRINALMLVYVSRSKENRSVYPVRSSWFLMLCLKLDQVW